MQPTPLQYRTPVSELRCTLAKSLGFSREFNSRNIEHYWYPSWNHTLVELIADIPNLIVAPQFPLWFVEGEEEEEEPEGPEDGEDLDEDKDAENDPKNAYDSDSEEEVAMSPTSDFFDDGDVGNASFSSGTTIPQKNAHSQFVDYAIVRVAAMVHNKHPSRYAGWRITQEHVPVLVEEKRYPSRSLTQAELEPKLDARLEEAHHSLKIQAGHLFQKYPGTDSVIAIAASGPYWSYTTIFRQDFISDAGFLRCVKTGNYAALEKATNNLKWTAPHRLDTVKSTLRFQTIYNQLRDLPVMEA